MIRDKVQIHEEYAQNSIWQSMNVYPNEPTILPLMINVDIHKLREKSDFPMYSGPPMRCKNCGAYLNPYCLIQNNPSKWKCVICSSWNSLPLPPSNSFYSGHSIAQKSVPYNSVVFDINSAVSDIRPVVFIVVQSVISYQLFPIFYQIIENRKDSDYCLLVFDSQVQVYDFVSHRFLIICEEDGIFLPSIPDRFIGKAKELASVLRVAKINHGAGCSINLVASLIAQISNSIMHHIMWFIMGPVTTYPEKISGISTFFLVGYHYSLSETIRNNVTLSTRFHHIENLDSELLIECLCRMIEASFSEVITSTPLLSCRYSKNLLLSEHSTHSSLFTFTRTGPNSSLVAYVQFEVNFETVQATCQRYICIRIPMCPDGKYYRSSTFINPTSCFYTVFSYIIEEIFEKINKTSIHIIRNHIMSLAYKYPIILSFSDSIYSILKSDILNENNNKGILPVLLSLKSLPLPFQFLRFVSVDYDGEILYSPLKEKNRQAISRITYDKMFIQKNHEDVIEYFCSRLRISPSSLTIEIIDQIPQLENDDFIQWEKAFKLNFPK